MHVFFFATLAFDILSAHILVFFRFFSALAFFLLFAFGDQRMRARKKFFAI
jgi:hypothetical protein